MKRLRQKIVLCYSDVRNWILIRRKKMHYWSKEKIIACIIHVVLLLALLLFSVFFRNYYSQTLPEEPLPYCTELAFNKLFHVICSFILFVFFIKAKNNNCLIYLLCVDIVWLIITVMALWTPLMYILVSFGS